MHCVFTIFVVLTHYLLAYATERNCSVGMGCESLSVLRKQ